MKSEEKIYRVLERIKGKIDIAPQGVIVNYRAGWEADDLTAEDEIMILNKLADEGIIDVVRNFSSDF